MYCFDFWFFDDLFIFLLELYEKICKKSRKNRINEIKDCFKIKIIQGEKFIFNNILKSLPKEISKKLSLIKNTNKNDINIKESNISDISSIISNTSSTGKRIKYKLKEKEFGNSNKNKVFYSIISVNPFKRKNIPIANYNGFVPHTLNFTGKTEGASFYEAFSRSIIINNKNNFGGKIKFSKTLNNYSYYNPNRIYYLNVYDYILTIKKVDNEGIIYAAINDISDLLKNYEERITFIKLLNCDFFITEGEGKRYFDFDDIEFDYKIPKLKNSSLIKSSYRKNWKNKLYIIIISSNIILNYN